MLKGIGIMIELLGKALELLLKLSPEFRSIAIALAAIAGGTYYMTDYVNAKHEEVTQKIKENDAQMQAIAKNQVEVLSTLKLVSESMKDVKDSFKGMDDRIWQIGRDVYMIKNKNGG